MPLYTKVIMKILTANYMTKNLVILKIVASTYL